MMLRVSKDQNIKTSKHESLKERDECTKFVPGKLLQGYSTAGKKSEECNS